MSNETMTPQGNGTVQEAADQFLSLMGDEEVSQEEPTEVAEEELEASESEDSEEEYEETEEVEEYEPEEPPRYRVKAAGEEKEVTLDELVKGYQLGADYTKKTTEVAEQRKALEAERMAIEQAKQIRDQYAQRLQLMEQFLQQPEEDIESLKDTDPIGYAVKVAEQTQREKQLQAVREEQARIAQQQQAEQAQNLRGFIAHEAEKLSAAIPEYADKEKGHQLRQEIRSYAKSLGWSDEELSAVYDSRAVLTIYKAMQYDKLQQRKPAVTKKVAEAPRMVKPGTAEAKTSQGEQLKKERQKLRKSGRVADAASIFERFI
jgi:hypothetical protein